MQSTTFSSIANAARKKFAEQDAKISSAEISLAFDGDTLEPPDGMVKDTEIEDTDCIEVYVK